MTICLLLKYLTSQRQLGPITQARMCLPAWKHVPFGTSGHRQTQLTVKTLNTCRRVRKSLVHDQPSTTEPDCYLMTPVLVLLLGLHCRSQWPRGLRHRSAAVRLLGLWVRISPGAWMSVSCECCVLSSRGLCDGTITRPEESYRVWCV